MRARNHEHASQSARSPIPRTILLERAQLPGPLANAPELAFSPVFVFADQVDPRVRVEVRGRDGSEFVRLPLDVVTSRFAPASDEQNLIDVPF